MTSELLQPPVVAPDAPLYRFELTPHNCFVCGQQNAHGLHIEVRARGGRIFADLTLGADHEGWAGIAHGGIIAALLDEVMEWALFERQAWGLTAEMTVRYRRPVRIGSPIRVEGWLVENQRRRYRTAARLLDLDGTVLADAQGVYLAARPSMREELRKRYAFQMVLAEPPLPEARPEPLATAPSTAAGGLR